MNAKDDGAKGIPSMVEFEADINYTDLKEHIKLNHPHDNVNNERISIWAGLGGFPCSKCCYRTNKDEKIIISDVQKQMGIGPLLMLSTTKSLAWLFFFLAFIHIPVYFFYFTANEAANSQEISRFQDVFAKLSLGNIG